MEDFHDDPDEASERLNFILHAVYDNAEEDIETQRLEQILHYAWESWQQDKWVDHTLATWDDASNDEIS